MREIVIVISDLFLPPQLEPAASAVVPLRAAGGSWPGIEHVARFAHSRPLSEGWRAWVARWLGLGAYADRPAASIAAASLQGSAAPACWLATPLHLIEGLTRVHVDWRCRLRLRPEERQWLGAGFTETFRGSGFELIGLESGEFLLGAPALAPVRTLEPARLPLAVMAESLPSGEGAAALRRLGAEIEMWLHTHPLNAERVRRGEPSVSTLWVWGGGGPAVQAPVPVPAAAPHAVFGSDAYVQGLCRLAGIESRPVPCAWAGGAGAPRTLCAVDLLDGLRGEGGTGVLDALADLDRRLIAPWVDVLRQGGIERLRLLANDRLWSLRAADRWRLWRRRRTGLGGLT